ncbi:DUF4440 domain-containing protein [[Kitasatospora] papulosa]|uniref:DUF4440 domain-containing protein n=1 Tax=Streptomyces TaxID=1883 RepID=UPI002FF3830B
MIRMDPGFARRFAVPWQDDWNSRGLGRILPHDDQDGDLRPPVIAARLTGGTAGTGYGKASLRSSWAGGLERIPDLEFEVIGVRAGVDALVIDYRSRIGTGCARC